MENVELVRAIYAAWESGDYRSTDWADPEIEIASISELSVDRVKGVSRLGAFWREVISPLEGFSSRAEEFHALGADRVVVFAAWSGRGKASGLEVTRKGTHVFRLRDRKVLELLLYQNRERALADLGVEAPCHLTGRHDKRRDG